MKYFSTQRPLTPGAFPKSILNPVMNVVNFDQKTFCEEIGRDAWGYVEYARALDLDIAEGYELIPVPTKMKKLHFVGVDSWGREVYEDENGKIWKYSEYGEMPRERHDTIYTSTGNDFDGEPCWPLHPDYDYEIVEKV